jgi:hypothetical protein
MILALGLGDRNALLEVEFEITVRVDAFDAYPWTGRTRARHRTAIRQYLGFREPTVQDAEKLVKWLIDHALPHQPKEAIFGEKPSRNHRYVCELVRHLSSCR